MNETMGIDSIGRTLHSGKINRQAERLRGLLNLRIDFDRSLLAAKFAFQIEAAVHTLSWHIRIELERVPFNCEGMIWMVSQRLFKMGFADIAPGANRVRHYIKLNHN